MMALLHMVQKWRHYLLGRHFFIKTDHQSLKHLIEQRVGTSMQQRWASKLMGFDYEIIYNKGKNNIVADAFSHNCAHEDNAAAITAISTPFSTILEEITSDVLNHPEGRTILDSLRADPNSKLGYSLIGDSIRYKHRVWLPANSQHIDKLLYHFHATPEEGHSGALRTYKRLSQTFYWVAMKRSIREYVAACDTCQRNKAETLSPPGPLQPLPIPTMIWSDISMDFIEGLPHSHGKSVIFVVVDRLSKYAHFVAVSHPFTAASIAQIFIQEIARLHGMPRTIVSDRDKIFLSQFWQEFFRLQGTQLCMSSAYHPQTDGQTEVLNRCLETYLRCFAGTQPKQWTKWLPWAEWWYNTTYHASIQMTPFEALYGRHPPSITSYTEDATAVAQLDSDWRSRDHILRRLKEHLVAAQARMKVQSDKHRTERTFEVGDWVFLRLQPYRQASLAMRSNMKLAPKYYGPYQVVQQIGKVAYKLDLPPHSKIHPVFHVSLLKKKLGSQTNAYVTLPPLTEEGYLHPEPEAVLDSRVVRRQNRTITEVLVQWKGMPKEEAAWEVQHHLKHHFPKYLP
ncbi:transposon Tf2-1 polyprotein [Cinnamomum micranthum f. kanehirae]|uniref:Transposon Tf2-1 polyprotein n=1 Tax=Cinnamomum micranthum f. kanehirae TaxID=337451 RepID=A0A443PCX4_9MAGN|nr:transposon Tf2-1 polyprotein [Cinnamomum micranthum f. kanehirae]